MLSEFYQDLVNYSGELEKLRWEGTFEDYLNRVVEKPRTSKSAHRVLYEAITSRPNFFETGENALFGLEKTTDKLKESLEAGANRLEVGKRIILLMGPVGGGKTTLVNSLKKGLEKYSLTDEGALYAVSGCPMNEDPLHLIPEGLRDTFKKRYGVDIDGWPCPSCQHEHGNKPLEELRSVPVQRIFLSERNRVGIGTFKPSDPKSQDITELVGSVNFSQLPEFGTASHPRAYRFDGELNIANRGMMEFVEMLKVDEKFLYALLDLVQDKVIKSPRFPNIYADEVIIAHTNETEYMKFVQNKANEAIKDRTRVISVPYNLGISDEIKIYEKLINQSELIKDLTKKESSEKRHLVAPNTLKVASMFAVLTRLKESSKKDITKVIKMKIYNEENTDDTSRQLAEELHEEFPREGMDGISPRYVIDSLSAALVNGENLCITPIDALIALKNQLDYHPQTREMEGQAKEEIVQIIEHVVREEYNDIAKKEVQKAFVYSFSEQARSLCDNYLENVVAFCNNTKLKDPLTGEDIPPDEKLMRSIEEQISITENQKREFRQAVLNRVSSVMRKNKQFDYQTYPQLRDAIEKKLFLDTKDIIKFTTGSKVKNEEQLKKISEVARRLIDEDGYCVHCANELLNYAGKLLR